MPTLKSAVSGTGHCINEANVNIIGQNDHLLSLRASLHEPGLDTDPGQFSVEFYVYTSPGLVRAGSFSADPGQFSFRWVERAGDYLSVRKMVDEPCNHQNHQFVADKLNRTKTVRKPFSHSLS